LSNDAVPEPDHAASFSRALELTLHRAFACANARQHQYATLEHLLLALIDDADASALMKACQVDLAALRENLASFIDNDLKTLVTGDDRDATPTFAFQRVVQRALLHVRGLGREMTGGDMLVAMFAETESRAVWLLGEQAMTRQDAMSFIVPSITPRADEMGQQSVEQGVVRRSFSHGRTKPVVVEKVKRRAAPTVGKTVRNARPAPPR
jgi:ATP-dependent Clp protease ATP-binding subunit ClpA